MLWVVRFAAWLTDRGWNFPGRWRLFRWLAGRTGELQLLAPKRLRLDGGTLLLVEAFNNRGHYLETATLAKDTRVVRLFQQLVRPGDVVLDVGANIGRMSVLASRLVGAQGRVFCFEPSPKVLTSLYRNLQLNGCANVTAYSSAVADVAGVLMFNMPVGTNSGWGSLRDLGEGAALRVEVSCRRLDDMLSVLPKVALMKIDVEGADLKVVRGALAMVQRDQPVIALEYSPDWIRQMGDDPAWLLQSLGTLGYRFMKVTDAALEPLAEVPAQQVDLLCLPPRFGTGEVTWQTLGSMR